MGSSDLDSKCNDEQELKDEFSKLSDDLFIFILTKIRQQDLRFIFQCTLISKRFATLVPLMPCVTFSISTSNFRKPTSEYYSKSSLEDNTITDRILISKIEYLNALHTQIQKSIKFLRKFNRITSVEVVLINDDEKQKEWCFQFQSLPSLIRWKINFGFKLQSFVFLFAQSVTEQMEQEEENIIAVTEEELESRVISSSLCVVDSDCWGKLVLQLLVEHPMLSEVTVAGMTKGGKICLKDHKTSDLRNSLTQEEVSRIRIMDEKRIRRTLDMKSAYIPVLHLPLCGYMMKGVSLYVARFRRFLGEYGSDTDCDDNADDYIDSDHNDDDDDDILNWDFESEDEVFREAVTLILVHHKDKMQLED